MHKRERELTLAAAREARSHLLLHPVVGITMHRDLGHFARIKCYREILRHYPRQLAALSLLPLAMRGAGPREALWHAIIRRNYGCTDFIVERDHASPQHSSGATDSDAFYPSRAAQELAREHERELGIAICPAGRLAYSPAAAGTFRSAAAYPRKTRWTSAMRTSRPESRTRRRCRTGSRIRR